MLLVLSRVRTVVVFVLLLLFGSGVADAQEVVTYSVPSDAPEAEDFTVEVERQDVFVHDPPPWRRSRDSISRTVRSR
jgi:hypothetical protein